jgi:hypothetical protein
VFTTMGVCVCGMLWEAGSGMWILSVVSAVSSIQSSIVVSVPLECRRRLYVKHQNFVLTKVKTECYTMSNRDTLIDIKR